MAEFDLVKEQILTIEDFDNVDEKLMEQINGNEEYRRLFEECREVSALCSESVPMPSKNGVLLKDAVMARISDGDIAPRYLETRRFRFPFATVACLAVCAVVVLAAKTGIFGIKKSDEALIMNDAAKEFSAESYIVPSELKARPGATTTGVEDDANGYIPELASDGEAAECESITEKSESPMLMMAPQMDKNGKVEPDAKKEAAYNYNVLTDSMNDVNTENERTQQNTQESDAEPAVGGSGFGFESRRYMFVAGGIQFREGNFSDNAAKYIDEGYIPMDTAHKKAGTEYKEPSLLYFLAHEMKLSRADLEAYFESINYKASEDIYRGLLTDDLSESMQLLKDPCSFYNDGRLFTASEVYYMYKDGTLDFDINADTYDDEWQSCKAGLDAEEGWGDDFFEFINDNYNRSLE